MSRMKMMLMWKLFGRTSGRTRANKRKFIRMKILHDKKKNVPIMGVFFTIGFYWTQTNVNWIFGCSIVHTMRCLLALFMSTGTHIMRSIPLRLVSKGEIKIMSMYMPLQNGRVLWEHIHLRQYNMRCHENPTISLLIYNQNWY